MSEHSIDTEDFLAEDIAGGQIPSGDLADRALLVGTYASGKRDEAESHLDELELLAETYGAEVVARMSCPLRKVDARTFMGKGKVEELVGLAKECEASVVIFDDEIMSSQQRNLERAFGLSVMDRTELILEVFNQRAQTKEARLQVELARIRYQFPRLKRLWTHLHRQRGGGLAVKGEGEKQIELDRRMLQRRLERVEKELSLVKQHRETQRTQRTRSEIPVFALIGYTNAGKSTLLNALTEADVFAEDKLFATLDTTTRKLSLPGNLESLIIDTVGFIRKLPHLLVAAFKSTLEESLYGDILLHIIDVSHAEAPQQAEATLEVLKELGADQRPTITVLNKIDKDDPDIQRKLLRLRVLYPRTIALSAKTGQGLDELLERMAEELKKRRRVLDLRIPQSDYAVTSEIMRHGNVLSQEFEDNDVLLRAEVPASMVGRLEKYAEER
jgi:GTP-binding protein HflX